ncbi:MAG: NuoM family protein [Anaerolineae bacterium]
MNFPFLSVIIFSPFVGAVIIMALPKDKHLAIKITAAVAAFISLILSIYVFFAYDQAAAGIQFEEQVGWIPYLGISYHLGADGISLPMLLLTGIVIFCGVLVSWIREFRPKEFFTLLLLLVTGVFGVFAALDLFLLFVFYELAVLPMYLLIGIWGTTRKEYAAMKLTLYLLVGSAFSLVGALAIYFAAGLGTFDLMALSKAQYDPLFQRVFFLPIFVGFGVLAGLWPFHTWSPDGHVAAPTAVSMLHAGVLMKLGAYSALRVGVNILPQGAQEWLPWLVLLTVVNVVYGAMVAMAQTDFKFVIGYSSVSHMGLVSMGFAAMNTVGLTGSVLQMFSHGIMTALFFAVVGLVYRRAHTRHMPDLGGLIRVMPVTALAFMVGGFTSMGMPGLSGFPAEFQVLAGTWRSYPLIAFLAVFGVVITAAYIMRVVRMVFLGPLKEEYAELPSAYPLEKAALAILVAFLFIVGIYPTFMVNLIHTGVTPVVARLASAVF